MEIKNLKQPAVYLITGCFFIFLMACKAKQTTSKTDADTLPSSIKTEGIVSHQYKSQGCETIIICASVTDTLFLIPTPPLEKFDTDGLKISFTYHTLRVHNPKGCHQGIPAQISNIKSEK